MYLKLEALRGHNVVEIMSLKFELLLSSCVLIIQFYIVATKRCAQLRGIVCNLAKLRATVLELRKIVRSCAELQGVSRTRNCAQVKSTRVGNPSCY